MKFLAMATLAVVSLALTGCNLQQGDANVRAVLASACPAWDDNIAIYDAVEAEGVLSADVVNYANTTKRAVNRLCMNRQSATVISITAAGIQVYKMVDLALKQGSSRGVAVNSLGYQGNLRKLEGIRSKLGAQLKQNGTPLPN